MMNDDAIAQMLANIFPPKPSAPDCQIPAELQKVIDAAKADGLSYIPKVVVGKFDEYMTGRVEMNKYNETVILINTHLYCEFFGSKVRPMNKMQRTLAHELGHCHHMQFLGANYESHGFAFCEDYADDYARKLGYK